MDQELSVRVLRADLFDVLRPDPGVYVTLAAPDVQPPARLALDERSQPHIGSEQDLGVLAVLAPDVLDDLHGVRGGAAEVGLRLDLGGGVHVHHHDRPGVLCLPGSQLVGGDGVGQRAAGPQVWQQHGLLGTQDRRRLGHEVHAAEGDHRRVAGSGLTGERERVPEEIRHVLDLRALVVVRKDDRVALAGEFANLVLQFGDLARRGGAGDRSVRLTGEQGCWRSSQSALG